MKPLRVGMAALWLFAVFSLAGADRASAEFCGGIYTSCDGLCLSTWVELKPEMLECFLEQGINIDCRYEGNTPLITSVIWSPNPKVVKLLLNYGANVNARNSKGETALGVAERMRNSESNKVNWPALDKVITILRREGGTK